MKKTVCSKCGSDNIGQDAWVSPETLEVVGGPYDSFYCFACGSECSVKEVRVSNPKLQDSLAEIQTRINELIEHFRQPDMEDSVLGYPFVVEHLDNIGLAVEEAIEQTGEVVE